MQAGVDHLPIAAAGGFVQFHGVDEEGRIGHDGFHIRLRGIRDLHAAREGDVRRKAPVLTGKAVLEQRGIQRLEQGIQLIDTSINQTMSRSLMTSLTTLLVMIPLFIMASSELRSFLIPLMIGVFTGTYSSIFLCSPVFYELTKKEGISKYEDNKAKADKQRKKSAKKRDDEGIRL